MNRRKLGMLASVLFLCFGAVACGNQTLEVPERITEMPPALTVAPTGTPMPTATVVPIDGVVISEENFGDSRFCLYLKEKFDTDKNGCFSDVELSEVTSIWGNVRNILTPYSEMKGFSYFPELKQLYLNSADKVEICDVPKLTEVYLYGNTSVQRYRLGDVTIKNCPELEEILIRDMKLTEGKETVEFTVENCPELWTMYLGGEGMNPLDRMSLKISGAPKLTWSCGDRPGGVMLDTSVFQSEELPVVDVKNRKLDTSRSNYISWVGESVTAYEEPLTELAEVVKKFEEGFFVEVQEVLPVLYDEEGRKAYQVLVNNKYLSGEYYKISDLWSGHSVNYVGDALVMYSDDVLSGDDFFFEWQELLTMPIEGYSPLRGFYGEFYGTIPGDVDDTRHGLVGELFYKKGEEKALFGEVEVSVHYLVSPEDGLIIWTEEDYDKNGEERYLQTGVWLTDSSEEVKPEEDELPITREYFSNLIFREYLEENADLNHNGYLSVAEREAVTKIYAGYYNMGANVVDGFEYFPNLTKIHIGICEKLVCKNCPELRLIAVEGDETDEVEVVTENCPKLEVIDTNIDADEYWDNYLDW